MEDEGLNQAYCHQLNQETWSKKVYSSSHIFFSKTALSHPTEDITTAPPEIISYTVDAVFFNGTPLEKRKDDSEELSWRYDIYSQNGEINIALNDTSILENFKEIPFWSSRKTSLTAEDFSLLQQNPDFYLEQDGENFFQHHPFYFETYSGGGMYPLSAKKIGCFLTAHAPSLKDYCECVMNKPTHHIPFEMSLSSNHGPLTLRMTALLKNPLQGIAERLVYALNTKTQEIDLFTLTHFSRPLGKRYIKLKEGPLIPTISPENPSEILMEPLQNIDDWVHLEEDSEDLGKVPSSSPKPEAPAEPTPPLHGAFDKIETRTPLPNLVYFSRTSQFESHHILEKTAYRTKLSTLNFLRTNVSDLLKSRTDADIKELISQKNSEERFLFDCFLLKDGEKVSPEEFRDRGNGKSEKIIFKGSLFDLIQHDTLSSINHPWKIKWSLEKDQIVFTEFLQRCCDFLSLKQYLKIPFKNGYPLFQDRLPPTGYYRVTQAGDTIIWEEEFSRAVDLSHQPYRLTYGDIHLFFGENSKKRLETYPLTEASLPINALTLSYVKMSPQREKALLEIIQKSPLLSRLTLNGCVFNVGFLMALRGALEGKDLTEIDLSQSTFSEVHIQPQTHLFSSMLKAFTKDLKTQDLIILNNQSILVFLSKENGFQTQSPYLHSITVTPQNLHTLWILPLADAHTNITTLTIKEITSTKFVNFLTKHPNVFKRWSHLKYFKMTEGFKGNFIPSRFFSEELLGYSNLETLDLSETLIKPNARDHFPYLNTLSTNCPRLKHLILSRTFQKESLNPRTFFPPLRSLSCLESLDLSFNNLCLEENYSPFSTLPKTLKRLNLSRCFRSPIPLDLLEVILRSLNLTYLDISKSPFYTGKEEEYAVFIRNIQNLQSQTTLSVHYKNPNSKNPEHPPHKHISFHLDGLKITFTPFNIGLFDLFLEKESPNLTHLYFENIIFDTPLTEKTSTALVQKCPRLETLSLQGCFERLPQFLGFCPMLQLIPTLQELDLSGNDFTSLYNTPDNSYDKFKELLTTLLKRHPSLKKICFTGQKGKKISWHSRFIENRSDHHPEPLASKPSPRPLQKTGEIFISRPQTKILRFSQESIYFLGSLENYLSPKALIFQNISLEGLHLLTLLRSLAFAPSIHTLILKNCLETTNPQDLLAFLSSLRLLNISHLDISGHIFSHKDYKEFVNIVAFSFPSLREISFCIPKRENHPVRRAIGGGVLLAAGGVIATIASGGTLTLPYIAGVTGAGILGAAGGATSGYIARKVMLNKPSHQCLEALEPFFNSPLKRINVYNVLRSDKSFNTMEELLKEQTNGEIEFNFSAALSN